MTKLALLLIVLFASFNLFSQNGISFQGIARDAAGNAITGENVSVTFTIGDFSESQNLTTDAFGVFSAIIGSVETTDFESLVFANIDENLKVEVDGTTIYDDKFNTVPYAKAAENGVPVGSIMPFAGAVTSGDALLEPVPGWIVCNGATLTTNAKFDNLKTVLGTAWGTNLVPDLRGVFLRGINNGRTGDYADPETRDVGSFQKDNFESHGHTGNTTSNGEHRHYINFKGDEMDENGQGGTALDNWDGSNENWSENRYTNYAGAHHHTLIINETGGDETRPVNAGVNFIIKY